MNTHCQMRISPTAPNARGQHRNFARGSRVVAGIVTPWTGVGIGDERLHSGVLGGRGLRRPRRGRRLATQDLNAPFMRRLLVTLTFTFALLAPASAHAGGAAVIRDCADDGRLQGHYNQRELRDALNSIPSDVDEYTDCRDVIRRAAF